MIKPLARLIGILALALFVLSACNLPANQPTSSLPDLIGTSAAQTVVAQLTQAVVDLPATATPPVMAVTATLSPGQATSTTQPTAAPPTSTQSATQQPTAQSPTSTTAAKPCDRASFVADITYADGSDIPAGATFVKTWRLMNTGTCTWNSSYSLVFVDNNAMDGPTSQSLTSGSVAPGKTIDVSVTLKAPSTPGSYEGDWMLRNASNARFGIGEDAKSYFWVKINSLKSTRISMDTGSTSAWLDGTIAKNSRALYLANAQANQFMMVNLSSPDDSVYLEIKAPNGTVLASAADKLNYWQGTLPMNGDYSIVVISKTAASDFTLGITIPVRVTFKSGAYTASVDGTINAKDVNSYLLKASKNQTMSVEISSDKDDVVLAIFGLQDGKTYVKASSDTTSTSFKLPSTQDYVIQAVSNGTTTEDYTIDFDVR